MVLANSCQQLKNRGWQWWLMKNRKVFRKKGYRSLHSPNSEHGREEEYCFLESQNAKEHDSEPFCNFLATIFPSDLNALLIVFSHWKERRSWGRALRKKLLRLRIFPDRRLGRICSIMAASFGRNWSLKVYVFLEAFCLHLPNWFALILRIHTEGTSVWNTSVFQQFNAVFWIIHFKLPWGCWT